MNKIINLLKEKKSIPLDQFINIALYDKKFGYYMKKNPLGKIGDFITSPMISNLFGEMLAIWCVAYWQFLGEPKKIVIVELGPGDASLCNELLKTFKKFKSFYNSLEINLLEISHTLKKIQKNKINNKKVKWIKNIEEIQFGPIIFIGNEFFDSLAIKHIFKKKNLFFEKHITLSTKRKKIEFLNSSVDTKLLKYMLDLKLFTENDFVEYPIEAIQYLKVIAKKIDKFDGGLLIFDYGYLNGKNKKTLQSVKKHKYINIFKQPGQSDITSHINFKLFQKILKKNNLNAKNIVDQSEFLQKMGIIKRANIISKSMTFKEKANMFFRLKRLLSNKEMGSLFKVLLAQKENKNFSLGF